MRKEKGMGEQIMGDVRGMWKGDELRGERKSSGM